MRTHPQASVGNLQAEVGVVEGVVRLRHLSLDDFQEFAHLLLLIRGTGVVLLGVFPKLFQFNRPHQLPVNPGGDLDAEFSTLSFPEDLLGDLTGLGLAVVFVLSGTNEISVATHLFQKGSLDESGISAALK